MGENIAAIVWMVLGIILLVIELALPCMVFVFFGVGALLISLVVFLGIIQSISISILLWLVISFLLFMLLRRIINKYIPSKSNYQFVEDDVDIAGKIVEVMSRINSNNSDGRISYSGTTWPAISRNSVIEPGKKAKILYRDNISFVVEPYDDQSNSS